MKNIIEIKEEVKIGEVILEAGDRIKILSENSSIPQEYIVKGSVRPKASNNPPNQAYKSYGIKPDDLIGWFANKYNPALGWYIYKLSDFDKREFGDNAFRTYSEKTDTTSVIKFNLLTGTYAFIDSEAYERGIVKFDKMTRYDRLFIEPTDKAYDEFNIV